MRVRVNVGCGQTPTKGWKNFDNSLSLRLAKIPILPGLLKTLGLIDQHQQQFVAFAKKNDIEYGNAVAGLPLESASVDTLYSSHMLEHLDRADARAFLAEAFRVINPGGTIRIAVPDIKKQVDGYIQSGDADEFMRATHLCVPNPRSFVQKARALLVGHREHLWMYDGKSLSDLLRTSGYVNVEIMSVGETRIDDSEPLDLYERADESVYVEAEKPMEQTPN